MKNQVKFLSFGCRLNNLEAEKITAMLDAAGQNAIVFNTCAVTAEAERQCRQAVRKAARENPGVKIFITGCAATRASNDYAEYGAVIHNDDKLDPAAYGLDSAPKECAPTNLSKAFVQIQNGCNHDCAFCATRLLRGPSVSFSYDKILGDVRAAVAAGFGEIVLTGIDIAGYMAKGRGQKAEIVFLSDLCKQLLNDVQGIRRLRLSSMDPASPEIPKLIELMARDSRMMPRFHLSMQSGSDTILAAMKRRHTADIVRHVIRHSSFVTFSWDLICGFPGETEELFNDTCDLIRELAPIKLHVFPYSKRPGTLAAGMPGQVDKAISKQRVRIAQKLAFDNLHEFMKTKVGTVAQVLMEENNIARTPDDIGVIMRGAALPDRMICDVKLIDIDGENFVGEVL